MDNKLVYALCLLAFIFLFNKAGQSPKARAAELKEIQKQIEAANHTYFKALREKDPVLFHSLYTYDCWIMAPDTGIFCGPDATADYFSYVLKTTGMRNGRFISIQIYGLSEELVAETGFYQFYTTKHEQMDNGKYLVLWKKEGRHWKRFRDSFSSSRYIPTLSLRNYPN